MDALKMLQHDSEGWSDETKLIGAAWQLEAMGLDDAGDDVGGTEGM